MTKMLSASGGGASPPDPLTRGSAPDPRYRLVLRPRHALTPSAAYAWAAAVRMLGLPWFVIYRRPANMNGIG